MNGVDIAEHLDQVAERPFDSGDRCRLVTPERRTGDAEERDQERGDRWQPPCPQGAWLIAA
jgi:hypothetical protein